MASHPYISGAGNIAQMIGFLRKNFPMNVTSETVKKFALAPNNESSVINALQFIGIIDQEGKRTSKGHDVFVLGEADFQKAFKGLLFDSYKDLFELRGDEVWSMSKQQLTTYFRTADKTSEVIGERQANVFVMFRGLAGYATTSESAASKAVGNGKPAKVKSLSPKKLKVTEAPAAILKQTPHELSADDARRSIALTVRVEINLPAAGSQETYDNIFKSIRANLIDQ